MLKTSANTCAIHLLLRTSSEMHIPSKYFAVCKTNATKRNRWLECVQCRTSIIESDGVWDWSVREKKSSKLKISNNNFDSFVLCVAVDVAAAATCRQRNADRYKSMEIVVVFFVRRIRQKIEIQNKWGIIRGYRKKNDRQKCSAHYNDTLKQQHQTIGYIQKMCVDVTITV